MNNLVKARKFYPLNKSPMSAFWNEFYDLVPRNSFVGHAFNTNIPAVDINETGSEFQVVADVPGVSKENIEVSVNGGLLSIIINSEQVKEENSEGRILRKERYQGQITRSFQLDDSVDDEKISASYKDGVLSISVPKKEQVQPKKIEVTVH